MKSREQANIDQSTLYIFRHFFGIILLYIVLIFTLPASSTVMERYNLAPEQYHILLFLVLLPNMLIWFAAFFGYAKLKQYTSILIKSPEHEDFSLITKGVKYLAFGMPIVSIVAICLYSITHSHQGFNPAAIIIVNYMSVLVPLLAYNAIRKGTHGLADRAKVKFSIADTRSIVFILVIIGVAYCYFTFRQLNLDSIGASDNPYYLPAWLMISTIIIPYLYAWFSGLIAAYEMILYSRRVQGVLYRQSMRLLSIGIVGVVAGGVGLQYLRTVIPRTADISIDSGLIWRYLFFVIFVIGFAFLIVGAIRLKKIEEV